MSEEKVVPTGVLIGLMSVDGSNENFIGISMNGQLTMTLSIQHAGMIFNQIGDLLEVVGYFEDDDEDDGDEGEKAKCKLKH